MKIFSLPCLAVALLAALLLACAAMARFEANARQELEQAMRQYGQTQSLLARYELLRREARPGQARPEGNLFVHVNRICSELGLSGRIDAIRPAVERENGAESLDLRLKSLYLGEFLRFLDGVEGLAGVNVDRLSLNRSGDMLLELEMRISRKAAP